ncbi:MAG TPA: hypothetical protein PK713_05260 [Candidatus Cloacimonas sp.]|nr:hypothetical protein [Candidatus Cloacimonas sp.]HQP63455.1 hypothetical protein [Candidatus Cloacimonas sp.]
MEVIAACKSLFTILKLIWDLKVILTIEATTDYALNPISDNWL